MEMPTWSLGMLQELGLEGVSISSISFVSKNPQNKLKTPEQTQNPQNKPKTTQSKPKTTQSKPSWRECLEQSEHCKAGVCFRAGLGSTGIHELFIGLDSHKSCRKPNPVSSKGKIPAAPAFCAGILIYPQK